MCVCVCELEHDPARSSGLWSGFGSLLVPNSWKFVLDSSVSTVTTLELLRGSSPCQAELCSASDVISTVNQEVFVCVVPRGMSARLLSLPQDEEPLKETAFIWPPQQLQISV